MPFNLTQKINLAKVFFGIERPVYVQMAFSGRCNMRCGMCAAVESRRGEEELDLPQIERLASVLRGIGAGFIILTGGEPLLRRDLLDAVRIFAASKITVRLQSNGLLVREDTMAALRDAGVEGVTMSLHSLSPEKMASITGVPGALEKIAAAISVCSKVFSARGCMTGINTVVSALNIREIPAIIEFTDKIGMPVSLIPAHISGAGRHIVRGGDDVFSFRESDHGLLDSVYGKVLEMKKAGMAIYNSERFLRETPVFLKGGRVSWRCRSPGLYFSVSPSGVFLPCVDLPGKHAMTGASFPELWRKGVPQKEASDAVKNCPGCMYACYPEFSWMLESKMFFIKRFAEFVRLGRKKGGVFEPSDVTRMMRDSAAKHGRDNG